jgi:predicted  nucleic acid-binding Zn-ribbon protein
MHIDLTREQAEEAGVLLRQDGAWLFRESIRLGDHAHDGARIWLKSAGAAEPVETEQSITMPEVHANGLRDVSSATPSSWPAPHPLALTTRYRWTVVPPRVPAGAIEDALIRRWKKSDTDWLSRLSDIQTSLEAAEGSQGRIARTFSSLMSAMMGFKRTQGSLLKKVTALTERRPSKAGPAIASDLFTHLKRLEEQTKTLQVDLEEAERKAREDEEREKQKKQWRRKSDDARRDIPEHKKELADAESRRPGLEEQIAALSEELKNAGKKAKRRLGAQRGKLKDESTRLDKTIQSLIEKIASLEQTASEPFTFRPPKQPSSRSKGAGGRFVPASSSARPSNPVPAEALPGVGLLRSLKGRRYLVIDCWEDLVLGEAEANRLEADLVAPEGV